MKVDNSNEKQDDRALAITAFVLFLAGFLLPRILHLTGEDQAAGVVMEILALIFGVMSRRQRLGKIAAIGAAIFCALGIINFIGSLFRRFEL